MKTKQYDHPTVQAFCRILVYHPRWNTVFNEVMRRSFLGGSQEVVVVVGPSGAGKTAMAQSIFRHLSSPGTEVKDELQHFPEEVKLSNGIMYIIAKANEESSFGWKDFYTRMLGAINPANRCNLSTSSLARQATSPHATVDELRRRIENEARAYNLKFLIVDEAQDVQFGRNPRVIGDQLNALKSFATTCGVKLLLAGTYKLVLNLGGSGQLARRLRYVNFSRYDRLVAEDQHQFRSTVFAFADAIKKVGVNCQLDPIWELLYSGSLGCIGTLKLWLADALALCVSEKRQEITTQDIQNTMHRVNCLHDMFDEVEQGEKHFRFTAEDFDKLNARLNGVQNCSPVPTEKVEGLCRKSPPFEQNPTRRTIGIPEE